MKSLFRSLIYIVAFFFLPILAGVIGIISSMNLAMSSQGQPTYTLIDQIAPPHYDPAKPTVAILVGNDVPTEVIDFLAPYELFASTQKFNVFAVAPEKRAATLTGGLDLMPHFTFAELDTLLASSSEVIVIPAIFNMEHENYQAISDYIQKHSSDQTILLSICAGAGNLAETGLLYDKKATSHWGDVILFEKKYPEVHWVRDQRYVVEGSIVSSAGLSSGVDATLYVISQLAGEEIAQHTAQSINYPNQHYVTDPSMEPFKLQWKDTIYLLNNAYRWNKQKVGVLLYNQMDEFALATIFDTYSASGTMETLTIAEKLSPIQTKNGLTLLPRYTLENAPPIERMLLSGTKANVLTNETISLWKNEYPSVEFSYVHAHEPDRYVLEAPLEDLAQQTDVLTAEYAAKRLEYRADTLKLEGAPYPYLAIPIPLLLGCASLVLLVYFQKRLRKNRGF